jgi:hypothetical protein
MSESLWESSVEEADVDQQLDEEVARAEDLVAQR